MHADSRHTKYAFIAQLMPSKSRVFAVIDRGNGPLLEAIATVHEAAIATELADALNGIILQQYGAQRRIDSAIADAPESVRAAIRQLVPNLQSIREKDPTGAEVVTSLRRSTHNFATFPTTNCLKDASCATCGEYCVDNCRDCDACEHGSCVICTPPPITPRTALILHTTIEILSDWVYDFATELAQSERDDTSGPWPLPDVVAKLGTSFARQMARSFDDLSEDLKAGRLPLPSCVSEEIVLYQVIRFAEENVIHDGDAYPEEMEEQLPESPFDYEWDRLRDELFQDHDFLDWLDPDGDHSFSGLDPSDRELMKPQNWFQIFGDIPERNPARGFRR